MEGTSEVDLLADEDETWTGEAVDTLAGLPTKGGEWLYFLHVDPVVKVGRSTNPRGRVKGFLSMWPVTHSWEMIGLIANAGGHERFIHYLLKKWHTHGEWFICPPSIVDLFGVGIVPEPRASRLLNHIVRELGVALEEKPCPTCRQEVTPRGIRQLEFHLPYRRDSRGYHRRDPEHSLNLASPWLQERVMSREAKRILCA